MKKNALLCTLILCLTLLCASAHAAEDLTGNINLLLGAKCLDTDDWEPVEDQYAYGFSADFRPLSWPVSLCAMVLSSFNEEKDQFDLPHFGKDRYELQGATAEFDLGVKKIFDVEGDIHPFVGGGLAIVSAEMQTETAGLTVSDSDSGYGGWIGAGLYWTLNQSFNLGFEAAYSRTEDVDIFNKDRQLGGAHLWLLCGYHW